MVTLIFSFGFGGGTRNLATYDPVRPNRISEGASKSYQVGFSQTSGRAASKRYFNHSSKERVFNG